MLPPLILFRLTLAVLVITKIQPRILSTAASSSHTVDEEHRMDVSHPGLRVRVFTRSI